MARTAQKRRRAQLRAVRRRGEHNLARRRAARERRREGLPSGPGPGWGAPSNGMTFRAFMRRVFR